MISIVIISKMLYVEHIFKIINRIFRKEAGKIIKKKKRER